MGAAHILLVGLSHHTAPLNVREKVSFSRTQLEEALPALRKRVGDSIIVSTCNRTEVYTATSAPAKTRDHIVGFLSEFHGIYEKTLAPHLFEERDADAARHLFRVASGLDSFILGESEVLGQVRNALTASSDAHRVEVPLSRLFHGAIRSGRRVRDETDIGRNALSVSFAGVRLVQKELGDLGRLHVLLVGAGEAGKLVARALRTSGVGRLTVTNRTHERAVELARDLAADPVPFEDMPRYLDSADVLITATEVPGLLGRDDISNAMHSRPQKPMFVLDLGMPRNVAPEAGDVHNVRLYNIDDLSAIAEENLQLRKSAARDAERIVEEELSRFMRWWESQEAVSAVKQLQERAEAVRLKELERALRKLKDLTPEQRETIDALTRALTRRLLHDPSVTLKQPASKQHIQALRDLFKL
ncbi:MAG: glutamyl-tRNA reductase [SAR202 cluster bacterium]|nr:glutamyl-tRNA reductase [SAR202 cluster bacterium]